MTKEMSGSCKLVDSFAIAVQIMMALVAVASLLYKRSMEQPKRKLLVWCLDTSKQGIAASLVHFANILLAYISSVFPDASSPNPCVYYFLNLLLDTTAGVWILYIFLKTIHSAAARCGLVDIQMGIYGQPPRFWPWFKQLILFLFAWFFVKVIVAVSILAIPVFGIIATWLLSPLQSDRAQIVVVMFIFPLCMNVVQGEID